MATQVTTVVTTQPAGQLRDWSSGVFGCFEDISSCSYVIIHNFFVYSCTLSRHMNAHILCLFLLLYQFG